MDPFSDASALLTNARNAITADMSRMWPEDVIVLEPGSEVLMLISKQHPMLLAQGGG